MATNYQDIANQEMGGAPPAAAPSPGGAIDPQVFQTATNYATSQAQNAYNNAKLRLETEQQAFAEAQQAYTNAMNVATTFGTSPGGTYNGMQLPSAGTPTMAQVNQWVSAFGQQAAPGQNQYSLAAQQQAFNQQQQAAQNYAAMSGYYTPQGAGDVLGTINQGVNLGQIDQMLRGMYGNNYDAGQFAQWTQALQGANLTSPQAMQAVNTAISRATQGRATYATIAGGLPGGGYNQAPTQAQTMAMQAQQAGLTGMTTYQPYQSGAWLYDPQTGTYGQVSANGQVRNFSDFNQAKQAGMPTADWAGGNQVDPARVTQVSSANNWGGIGGQMMTPAYQQQRFSQALQTAQFQAGQAQDYLKLLSSLQGPANYGNYLRTLGATPAGLQGLTAAAAGAYIPGGGATTGVNPQAQTLQNFVNSATSGVNQAGQAQGGVSPYQAAAAGGSATPGQQQPGAGTQPTAAQAPNAQPAGGTGTSYQDFMNAAQNLPAPNQLAPQAWNAMTPSQQQMLTGMYSQMGYDANDVQALFNQSLPKYAAGQGVATGSFRLQ